MADDVLGWLLRFDVVLNFFFWLGGAVHQQISGVILAEFPKVDGRTPVAAYQTAFWFCVGSVGLSIVLIALSTEHRPRPATIT